MTFRMKRRGARRLCLGSKTNDVQQAGDENVKKRCVGSPAEDGCEEAE